MRYRTEDRPPYTGQMPKITEAAMRELQMKYKIAHEVYVSSVEVLTQARSTNRPSAELLAKEIDAHRQLTEARANLLAAWTQLQPG